MVERHKGCQRLVAWSFVLSSRAAALPRFRQVGVRLFFFSFFLCDLRLPNQSQTSGGLIGSGEERAGVSRWAKLSS